MCPCNGTTNDCVFVINPVMCGFGQRPGVPLRIRRADNGSSRGLNAFSFWADGLSRVAPLRFSFKLAEAASTAPEMLQTWVVAYVRDVASRAFSHRHSADYWTIAVRCPALGKPSGRQSISLPPSLSMRFSGHKAEPYGRCRVASSS